MKNERINNYKNAKINSTPKLSTNRAKCVQLHCIVLYLKSNKNPNFNYHWFCVGLIFSPFSFQQLAVEAIINSSTKKARCSALLQEAVPVLKKLYHDGVDDHIKVRALVVSMVTHLVHHSCPSSEGTLS